MTVTSADLLDAANKECSICLETNELGTGVCRMPCGHLFHPQCLHGWIKDHCTCPTCRYELETDDRQYEEGRRTRMQGRKLRFHLHELERMGPSELKALVGRAGGSPNIWRGVIDKKELVDKIVKSGIIDMVKGTESEDRKWREEQDRSRQRDRTAAAGGGGGGPTTAARATSSSASRPSVSLRELRAKKVKDLKDVVRNKYHVDFDNAQILEREDLITVLRQSGKVYVINDDDDDDDEQQQHATTTAAAAAAQQEKQQEKQQQQLQDDDYIMVDESTGAEPKGAAVDDRASPRGGGGGGGGSSSSSSSSSSRNDDADRRSKKRDVVGGLLDGEGAQAKEGGGYDHPRGSDDDKAGEEKARYGSGIRVDDLKRKSAGELRKIAKEGKVDITDCLEKGDIVKKILASGTVLIANDF